MLETLQVLGIDREAYVFRSRVNLPDDHMKSGTITRKVSRHLRQLGIDATCESLRQRFMNVLYNETDDVRAVQELVGHKRITSTAAYTVVNVDDIADAVARV